MSADSLEDIVAPVYGPLVAYHQPIEAPFRLGVATVSVAELRSAPATWAIVLAHAPVFQSLVKSPDVMPYLSTMTVDSFLTFGDVSKGQIDAIDADLARLPHSQWPQL